MAGRDLTIAEVFERLVKGERVTIRGFGSFGIKTRPARKGRNPKTGAPIDIPARKVIKFKSLLPADGA